MADNTDGRESLNQLSEADTTEDIESTPVELKYPKILLAASFESLLSHSTSSSQSTIVMLPSSSSSAAPLDESWASLDPSDFPNDDDLHSEATDTESLIELSSAHDTESAIGNDAHSEASTNVDNAINIHFAGSSHREAQQQQEERQEGVPYTEEDGGSEDSIVFHPIEAQQNPDVVDVEYICQLGSPSLLAKNGDSLPLPETLRMTISTRTLDFTGEPFKIAYYGTISVHEAKDELLGKIGAALVPVPARERADLPTTSPCFNIVPTEFGTGSKPVFADLVPSQAQMTVDDLTISRPSPAARNSIKFALERGLRFNSQPRTPGTMLSKEPWRPDLLVVHVGRDDAAEDFSTVTSVLELAQRHFWPTITVMDNDINGLCPEMHEYGIVKTHFVRTENGLHSIAQPIDLESFVNVNTDQLNRHIKYIVDAAQRKHGEATTLTAELRSQLVTLWRHVSPSKDQTARKPAAYTLEQMQPGMQKFSSGNAKTKPAPPKFSLGTEVKKAWSAMDFRHSATDILLILLLTMLGTYMLSLSQNMFNNVGRVSEVVDVSLIPQETVSTTTITASTIHLAPSSTAPSILSFDHDAVVCDRMSFDQIWSKLTGRPNGEGDASAKKEARAQSAAVALAEKARDEWKQALEKANASVQKWLSGSVFRTGNYLDKLAGFAGRQERRRGKRDAEIDEMHERLHQVWSSATKKVHDLGEQSRAHFDHLIARSRLYVNGAKGASEEELKKLVSRQKKHLFKAQKRAHALTHHTPKHKKRFSIWKV